MYNTQNKCSGIGVFMALDFQQVYEKVRDLGERFFVRSEQVQAARDEAKRLFARYSEDEAGVREKVRQVVRIDSNLRCAVPFKETMNARFPAPPLPEKASILAADGSQINPDRHAAVNYGLVNVGAIQMNLGSALPPQVTVHCELIDDEGSASPAGRLTEDTLALRRDLNERQQLVILSEFAEKPVITFTDGPMELWGVRDGNDADSDIYRKSLEKYLEFLRDLCEWEITTAGYVDKPAANLVVRLLEVMRLPVDKHKEIRQWFPLQGATDAVLFRFLEAGERSAVFTLQSGSSTRYCGQLALHFFYLNVGTAGSPWLARVEIPKWVAENPRLLDPLHAVLVSQCRIMGDKTYPYLLHRAHEAAVVSFAEKEQVTQMILQEYRRRGLEVDEMSHKQGLKNLPGRRRY